MFLLCILVVYRLHIKGIICKDFCIKSLDFSADAMNTKGKVNCAIKSCHCTFAVTKTSPIIMIDSA